MGGILSTNPQKFGCLHRNWEWFLGRNRKFERFYRPKSGGLQKKKKRSSPKLRVIFRPKLLALLLLYCLITVMCVITEKKMQLNIARLCCHNFLSLVEFWLGGARAPWAPPWLRLWMFIYFFINSGPNLIQTQILARKLTLKLHLKPNLNLILILKKGNKKKLGWIRVFLIFVLFAIAENFRWNSYFQNVSMFILYFCRYGDINYDGKEMNNKNWAKLCRDCEFIDNRHVLVGDIDVIFSRHK